MSRNSIIIITLLFTSLLISIPSTLISPVLPTISEYFKNVENADILVKMILTTPSLFIGIGAFLIGFLIDRFGRKRLLLISLIISGLSGFITYFLNSLIFIIMVQCFVGISLAGVTTIATTLIGDYYRGEERNRIIGLQNACVTFGGAVFSIIGGTLAVFSWRYPFFVYLICFIAFLLVSVFIIEPKRKKIDINNKTDNTHNNNIENGYNSYEGNSNLNASFNDNINKKSNVNSLPIKTMLVTYPLMFVVMIVLFIIIIQLPYFLKETIKVNSTLAGVANFTNTLFSGLAALLYSKIKRKLSYFSIFSISSVLIFSGYMIISVSTNYYTILLGMIISGSGFGLMLPNIYIWLLSKTTDNTRGRILGFLNMFLFVGQFFSPIINQPLIDKVGFRISVVIAGIAILTIGIIFLIVNLKMKIKGKSSITAS